MRRLILLLAVLPLAVSVGCGRPITTFSHVCAHLSPVRFESMRPIQVETTRPVQVQAQLVPPTQSALEEVMVAGARHNCAYKVAVIDVDGLIVNQEFGSAATGSENPVALFREKLNHLRSDPQVRAIVLRINSPGGGVTASDMMRRELESFIEETRLPVVACIMDVGAGGAYYLATAADEIIAHPTSIVGGMGVILNLYNLMDALNQFNIVGIPVKSGKNVDMGSPLRPIPEESRKLLQDIADEFHQRFEEVVRSSRPNLRGDQDLFDGRVLTAPSAQANDLIDSVGYLAEAIERAEQLGDCDGAAVAMLQRPPNQARTEYDAYSYQQRLLELPSLPGLDRSRLPTFLYIWQPDPSLTSDVGG
jgi:protease-4